MNKKNRIRKVLECNALVVLLLSGCDVRRSQDSAASSAVDAAVSIIPAPREIAAGDGQFIFTADTRIAFEANAESERVARYFTDLLQRTSGVMSTASASAEAGASDVIAFRFLASEGASNEEGYSLIVSPKRIVVSASDPRGLFYGAVSLWQMLTAAPGARSVRIPSITINDSPRFGWRGLMLDSARHYQSPEFIRQFIDVMALHKLNVLHWHLTDDQAWRLEIKKYPKLTSIGAWRVPAGAAAAADIDPATGKPRLYGGFYSQEQVREIVAYAAARHITIVPEIDMPGHASAAIAAYPELAVSDHSPVTARQSLPPSDWGVYHSVFNVEEATFVFLEEVLGEVAELFPGEYVHIGGDEAAKDQWIASARVQARMREFGVASEAELQSHFIKRMEKYLNARGKRLIGWDEILEGGLAPNATVMSWRGVKGAVAAAAAGHDAVLSPEPTLYFDYRPVNMAGQPGRGRVIDVEEVYRFDPAPAGLNEQQRQRILGLQANIWTEHMRSEDRVAYQTFPRAAALAEVAWSPAERNDWSSFSERLPAQLARYRMLGVKYADSTTVGPPVGRRRASRDMSLCSKDLVLSLEDDAPLKGERAVFHVDILNPCWIYEGVDLSKITAIEAAVGQLPFNFQIGEDIKKIPLRAPATPAGELEVRLDGCEGEKIAALPLASAATNHAVTKLPAAAITAQSGKHDLCFMFTQSKIDPFWVIDSIDFIGAGE
ncbi:MAG: family 20 glycosylhydrolase [Steroidobacter sp.]